MIEIVDGIKIFKTKIAIASEEKISENLKLEELGIECSIENEDVSFVDVWIRFDQIIMVEDTNFGDFNIYLSDGSLVNSRENPFKN